jgi:hypothetical protein
MPEDIQEHMRALIAQHGNVLAALATFQQYPEAQQNDKQTDSLENHVPLINALAKFNQDTSKSEHECCNGLQRKWHARQHTKSARPSETSQE